MVFSLKFGEEEEEEESNLVLSFGYLMVKSVFPTF